MPARTGRSRRPSVGLAPREEPAFYRNASIFQVLGPGHAAHGFGEEDRLALGAGGDLGDQAVLPGQALHLPGAERGQRQDADGDHQRRPQQAGVGAWGHRSASGLMAGSACSAL